MAFSRPRCVCMSSPVALSAVLRCFSIRHGRGGNIVSIQTAVTLAEAMLACVTSDF